MRYHNDKMLAEKRVNKLLEKKQGRLRGSQEKTSNSVLSSPSKGSLKSKNLSPLRMTYEQFKVHNKSTLAGTSVAKLSQVDSARHNASHQSVNNSLDSSISKKQRQL